jgi:DNA repair photolyase
MNYYELREIVKHIIPRKSIFEQLTKAASLVKEKGRKVNYQQFNLETNEMVSIQRLLNEEEITSFLEVSLRAAYCPMPLNVDVWDAISCPFRCRYCFADSFRASLYTSFFDNSKTLGLRHCKPDFFKSELDDLLSGKGKGERAKAMALRIPIRIGIRFEDFFPLEGKRGISKELLKYLADIDYPVMINTKSDLVGREDYLAELARNKSGAAVHITMLSSDSVLNKTLEPGAPAFLERVKAAKALIQAGVRVVARIEPFMVFINDEKDKVDEYCEIIYEAGIRHITLDTYSYSANSVGVKRGIESVGLDFERMFTLMSDAQWLGSLLLNRFTDYLRGKGFKCSTFDFGSVPDNDDDICCCVDDWFKGGYNTGNVLTAVRYIVKQNKVTSWGEYENWVETQGGFLSPVLRNMVFESWNLLDNPAYVPYWCRGVEPVGQDNEGRLMWKFNEKEDLREEMLLSILK